MSFSQNLKNGMKRFSMKSSEVASLVSKINKIHPKKENGKKIASQIFLEAIYNFSL
jgi:hypothetical protein